jgi:uncharacterized protein YndB with AHSA1/START domain
MNNGNIARVTTDIHAPIKEVWNALVDPALIEQYMFGAKVTSEWEEGSPIIWKGEWQGKAFEDKGTVLQVDEPHALTYSHLSAGDKNKSHTVSIKLEEHDDSTALVLTQDNNATAEARLESEKNWTAMLGGMKKILEKEAV